MKKLYLSKAEQRQFEQARRRILESWVATSPILFSRAALGEASLITDTDLAEIQAAMKAYLQAMEMVQKKLSSTGKGGADAEGGKGETEAGG